MSGNSGCGALHPWLCPVQAPFEAHRCPADARAMEAYMRHVAPFFGIKAPVRRGILKRHIALHGRPALATLPAIARSAFAQPEREWHHSAVDLLRMHAEHLVPQDLPWVAGLITTTSWWDTVDTLAMHVVGAVLRHRPKDAVEWGGRWAASDDLWLVRTAILFQNRWRHGTDRALLFAIIGRHAAHKDFFIRKAIGWALRELSSADPEAVRAFTARQPLSPLSRREALRKLG